MTCDANAPTPLGRLGADIREAGQIVLVFQGGGALGAYALALNLAIWVDDAMARLIASAGWDVPSYKTSADWLLPIPATFVVGADGRVIARYVNADYRTRMEVSDILAAMENLPQVAAAG